MILTNILSFTQDKTLLYMKIRHEIGALFMDLQDKLIANVHNPKDLINSNGTWLNICKLLGINSVITEQVPSKLGPSCQNLKQFAVGFPVITKDTFSAFGSQEFAEIVRKRIFPIWSSLVLKLPFVYILLH